MNQLQQPALFGVIRDVVDALYDTIGRPQANVDAEVVQATDVLRNAYGGLSDPNRPLPDYSLAISRLAYTYTYAATHAYFMRTKLNKYSPVLHRELQWGQPLHVTSFGGGPGSDLLGLFAHLVDVEAPFPSVACQRCDREAGWNAIASLLLQDHAALLPAHVHDVTMDVTVPASHQPHADVFGADVFLASFFLSELVKGGSAATAPFWDNLAKHTRRGSRFVIVDNAHDDFIPAIEAMMARAGFVPVVSESESMRNPEDWPQLDDYIVRYDRRPRRRGEVYFAMYIKA